mgnify:CR=1 FL=1
MNTIKTEGDIINHIQDDKWMMNILEQAKRLNLPDWWIGAGFIRSKVWDALHGYKVRTPIPDIDVIYFDKKDFSNVETNSETTQKEIYYESLLKSMSPNINWSVTNQARMYIYHNDAQYKSSEEGLSKWIETATCIGVKLNKNNKLEFISPHGISDLVNLIIRPTPNTNSDYQKFMEHIKKKQWIIKWPKLKVLIK